MSEETMNNHSNMEEESQENNIVNYSAFINPGFINIEDDVDANEANNVMNNSALLPSGSIKIKKKEFPYGKQIQEQVEEQDKYLLGTLEKDYTLETLYEGIIECQRYLSNKAKYMIKQQSPILQIDQKDNLIACFSLNKVLYEKSSCYTMSNDKKVLYEYNAKTKSIFSATYYGDDNKVYLTQNCKIINNLLQEHQVEVDDDVSIDDKNNMPVNNKSNISMNKNENEYKEEFQKVENDLNIYRENKNNNMKKIDPQFEGYEQKTNNCCNCCLDCLEWCKQLC